MNTLSQKTDHQAYLILDLKTALLLQQSEYQSEPISSPILAQDSCQASADESAQD